MEILGVWEKKFLWHIKNCNFDYTKFVFMKTAAIRLNIPNIRLYDIFRKDLHLPDERAHDLVQAIDEAVKEGYEQNLKGVATKEFVKEEIRGVRDEFQGLRNEFHGLRN